MIHLWRDSINNSTISMEVCYHAPFQSCCLYLSFLCCCTIWTCDLNSRGFKTAVTIWSRLYPNISFLYWCFLSNGGKHGCFHSQVYYHQCHQKRDDLKNSRKYPLTVYTCLSLICEILFSFVLLGSIEDWTYSNGFKILDQSTKFR